MSREIKFRAYVKDIDQLDENEIPHKGNFVYGNLVRGDGYDFITSGMHMFSGGYTNFEWQWMIKKGSAEQFTGLNDKNGKNIYEGDIVCVSDVYEDVCYVDAVIWGGKDDYPAFDLKNHAVEYDSNALSSIFNGDFEIIEVIGNVHTNPELLEAQHDTRTD